MKLNSYQPDGPLPEDNLYIERQADLELLRHVQAMDYVTMVVPRRQGKTSLVRHLMFNSSLLECNIFIYVNVSPLSKLPENEWYDALCSKNILPRLEGAVLTSRLTIPRNSFDWRDFLFEIASKAGQAGKRIVIILDEVETTMIDHNSSFFKTLREICSTSRVEKDSEFRNLAFILIGTFSPSDLIKDENGLTFNIGHRINIPDFTLEHVQALVQKRGWENLRQVKTLASRIYYWTGGHPYLTQLVCSHLEEKSSSRDIDDAVEKLLREDVEDLRDLIAGLEANTEMKKYACRILDGEAIPFSPVIVPLHRQLFLSGWIKANKKGYCSIRNRIYKRAFRMLLELSPGPSSASGKDKNMISPEEQVIAMQILKEAFSFIAGELKQRWKSRQAAPQNQKESPPDPEPNVGISEVLQSKLVKQLENTQNVTELEMLADNLKTALSMAKGFNQQWNLLRELLPEASPIEKVNIEMRIARVQREREIAVNEIKTIFEKISKEEITTY